MKKEVSVLILIVLIGAFLRLYQISSIPPGLYPDEAINGNNGWEAIKTNSFKVFYPENNGREGLYINLVGFFLKIFGYHHYSIRLVSVFFGILTLLGIYLLAKEIFKEKSLAFFSSFFLAISFWHLNFSRIGFRGILVPFFICFGFYLYFLAKRKSSKLLSFLCGIFLGLGFYSYIPYRAVLILILILFLWEIRKKDFKKTFEFFLPLILGGILINLPLGIYFLNHPSDFISRASGVSVFKSENPLKAFLESFFKHLLMFNFSGDRNFRHHFSSLPQLLNFDWLFFLIGILILFKSEKISKETKIFLPSGFLVFLLPSVLTYEGIPHSLRSIGVIPFVYLIVALGAKTFFDFFKNQKLKIFLLVGVLFFSFALTFYLYFFRWGKSKEVKDAFSYSYFKLAQLLIHCQKRRRNLWFVTSLGF
ncbi:glycosyltransferase family 39 protein [bacterium]|nr:glycosyltransferase family 39 protein [bacterium]